jgi:hypothetical protein
MIGEILISLTLIADLPDTVDTKYRSASDTLRRAIMEDKDVKQDLDKDAAWGERKIYKYTGLTEKQLVYLAYASPLVTQTVSTKPFKNLTVTLGNGWNLRPEIEYHFGSNPNYTAMMILAVGF